MFYFPQGLNFDSHDIGYRILYSLCDIDGCRADLFVSVDRYNNQVKCQITFVWTCDYHGTNYQLISR